MNSNETPSGSASVVVGVDGSAGSDVAVVYAAQHAAEHRLPLRIVNGAGLPVVTDFVIDLDEARRGLREHGQRVVDAAAALARRHGSDLAISVDVVLEDPRTLLLREAVDAPLLVLGSRGRGTVVSLLLGSVGVALTAHAPCPVVIARPPLDDVSGVLPVVVGVDGSPTSATAVGAAFDLASWQQRPLEIVHAIGDPLSFPYYDLLTDVQVREVATDSELRVAESVAGYAEKYPDVRTHTSVVLDSPAHALRKMSESAHSVVVGSRGRSPAARRWLGSVSRSIVENARCTVTVVPGEVR